jgi:hypothetical protein
MGVGAPMQPEPYPYRFTGNALVLARNLAPALVLVCMFSASPNFRRACSITALREMPSFAASACCISRASSDKRTVVLRFMAEL